MSLIRTSVILAVLIFPGLVGQAQAGIIVANGPQVGNRSDFTGTVGTKFNVGLNDLTLTALGYEDPGGDGLQRAHRVGLWSNSGILLASTTVAAGTVSAFDSGWRYATLTIPITLTAGATYRIGAETFSGSDAWTDVSETGGGGIVNFGFGSGIVSASGDPNVFSGGLLSFPGANGGRQPHRWAPANAKFAAVPEADSIAIWSLLGLVAAGVQWRCRGKASSS